LDHTETLTCVEHRSHPTERPKIDRLACPRLIRRFIDPAGEILYVSATQVLVVAKEQGAIPFDVSGVELTHSAASMPS
jgi:hypothetical protein